MHGRSKHAPKHMSLANESKPDRKAAIMLTCCALQSACYSPTGIVISFILAQIQGEVQTNLTVKRFLMCSAALCTSIAEELFIISRLSRSAERSKRIFTGGVVTASGSCSAAFYESATLRESAAGLRPLSQNLTVLPALPKGEPRALPETFSLRLIL